MICSITTANAGVQLLCSHEDGSGHVVDYDTHDAEIHASCVFDEAHEAGHEHSHSYEETGCSDTEMPDSELEDLSSNSDRSPLKAPSIQFAIGAFLLNDASFSRETHLRPPASPLAMESESRRFARTVQIRR